MSTRDQRLASAIFEQVEAVAKQPMGISRERYGSAAHKLPVLIRTAGLTQALHFAEARGGPEYALLLNHLAAAIGVGAGASGERKDALLRESRESQLGEYMRLTRESLAALLWYKRFAQTVLGVSTPDADGAEGGER